MVEVDETAPEFTLRGVDRWRIRSFTLGEVLRDAEFVVLSFYVYDFSPVCTTQLCELDGLDLFELEEGVRLFGVAPDGPYAQREFIDEHDLSYPLLCDTAERVAEAYGVLHEEKDGFERVPKRSMFPVDDDRTVQLRWVAGENEADWSGEPLRLVKNRVDELRAGG